MVKQAKTSRKKQDRSPAERPTIGLLSDRLVNEYSYTMWAGVANAAREHEVNLLYFTGSHLNAGDLFNTVFELVDPEVVDGLVIWSALLGHQVGPEATEAFCKQYRPLPMVSIGLPMEGIPSIVVDNYGGMHDLVAHLIEKHNCRRIAYLSGPEANLETQERYRGYTDALAEHGIALDPNLVVGENEARRLGAMHEYETYTRSLRGELAMPQMDLYHAYAHTLLARRTVQQVSFDAVIGHDDYRTLRVLEILKAQGVQVPRDVAMAGFDDIASAQYATPALTTARQPLYDLGRRATETLLAILRGEKVPAQTTLPMKVMVRESCGCLNAQVVQAAAVPARRRAGSAAGKTVKATFAKRREHIVSEIIQAVGAPDETVLRGWAGQLVDAFVAEMSGESSGAFLATLNDTLHGAMAMYDASLADSGRDLTAWQDAISVLRREALPYLTADEKASLQAENLWQQARVVIGDLAERVKASRALQADLQVQALREVGQTLTTSFDLDKIVDVVAARLPPLGVPRCYLSIYEDPEAQSEWSRLILAYDENGRVELEAGGRRFRSRQLVPEGISLSQTGPYSIVVEPLFHETAIGFVLFEVGARQGVVCEELRARISDALRGALLLRERQRTETALQHRALQLRLAAAVSHAAGSILDPDELTQQVVDLVRERFRLYYAGLFLVDETGEWTGEPGKWAVLRAGTGEAGRQLLGQKHKLEIGGTSMIGWCVANRRARIALDVGEEAVRFENPFLPKTRSELALPLTSRGQVIGALTIQSTQEAAFSDEDIAALQTMADQLANAIQSARAVEKERQTALLLDRRVKDLNFLNDIGRKMEELPPIPDLMQWLTERIPSAMQYPDVCKVAIEFEGHVYGTAEAPKLPRQMVRSLRLGGDFAGRVCIAYSKDYDFLNEESALLGDVVRRMSGYIENQRLLAETQETAQRMEALYETSRALSAATDEETAIRTVLESIYWAMACDYLTIATVDEQAGVIEDRHGIWHGEFDVFPEWMQMVRYPLDHPDIIADVYRTGRTEIIDGWDERFNREIWEKYGHENLLRIFMPVRAHDRIVGVVEVGFDRRKKERIDKKEVQTLTAFVDQAAVALENARLIRETRQAARRLEEERSLLRTLIDNLPDHIYVKDKESRFLISNATQLRLMGVATQDEIVDKTDADFFPGELASQHHTDEQEIMQSGQPLLDHEERIQDQATGQYRWMLTTKVPLRDSGGSVVGLVGISRDITERREAEAKLQRRAMQLQTAAEVARDATTAQELDELLNRTVNLVRDRFGFYHVGIFLVDEQGEYAILTAASGRAGQAMLEHGYKLKAGETGIVGYVTSRGQPRIALDVGADAVHFKNPYLPETRSELALPLKAGGQVIGALDVQSQQSAAFDQEDVQVLQIMADQLAVSIQNLRLLREMQQTVRELEVAYGSYTRRSWITFAQGGTRPRGYRYRRLGIEPAVEQSPEALEALQRGQPVITTLQPDNPAASSTAQDNEQTAASSLAVPIKLRGQTVGVLNLRFEEATLAQETVSMVEEIAERLALVLENARLMQEAQALVSREQRINLISSQVRSSISLDTILQNTVRELGRALGASRTFIQLGIEPDNPLPAAGATMADSQVQDEPHSPS
jgi:PAS domain S-box-containing protein